ncbi:hypothetical protein Tco_0646266 [Tanacetum coccineum]
MKDEGLKRQKKNSLNDDKILEDLLKEGNKINIDDLLKRIKTNYNRSRVDRLELGLDGNVWRKFKTTRLKRLKKVSATRRIESSNDSLGAQEDAFKQGRRTEDIDADAEKSSTKTGEAVTAAGVEDSAAPTIPTTVEETLAQTLMEIKAAKPKAKGIVFHDLEKQAQESNEKKVEGSEEQDKSSRRKSLGKKRVVKEHQQESPKRQKLEDDKETDEHEEVEVDDTAKLKKHLVIKNDDDIAIDAIPLATKPPMIVIKLLKKE